MITDTTTTYVHTTSERKAKIIKSFVIQDHSSEYAILREVVE